MSGNPYGITALRAHLDDVMGVPETAVEVYSRTIDLIRQRGRTTEMIRGLPVSGKAIILVSGHGSRQAIIEATKRLRPGYPVENLRFGAFKDWENDPHLRGLEPLPVFVDNAAFDWENLETVRRLNRIFNTEPVKKPAEPVTALTEADVRRIATETILDMIPVLATAARVP